MIISPSPKEQLWYTLPCGYFDLPMEQTTKREAGGCKYGDIHDHIPAEPSCRGKGLGLEATQLMIYYGKDTIAMCNVILYVYHLGKYEQL